MHISQRNSTYCFASPSHHCLLSYSIEDFQPTGATSYNVLGSPTLSQIKKMPYRIAYSQMFVIESLSQLRLLLLRGLYLLSSWHKTCLHNGAGKSVHICWNSYFSWLTGDAFYYTHTSNSRHSFLKCNCQKKKKKGRKEGEKERMKEEVNHESNCFKTKLYNYMQCMIQNMRVYQQWHDSENWENWLTWIWIMG